LSEWGARRLDLEFQIIQYLAQTAQITVSVVTKDCQADCSEMVSKAGSNPYAREDIWLQFKKH
jgi:hypothetical protein